MSIPTYRLAVAAALLQLLSACAATDTEGPASVPMSSVTTSPSNPALANRLGRAATGDVISVGGELRGLDTVVVGQAYTAASGRRCRPLSDALDRTVGYLVCELGDGWVLNDALVAGRLSPSATKTAPADRAFTAQSVVTPDDEMQSNTYKVRPGESLWSFAKRHTDDPRHWQAIAAHNAIENADLVRAGRSLDIPPALRD